jgi:hypothetical protein
VVRSDGSNGEWLPADAAMGRPSRQSYLVLDGDQPWWEMDRNASEVGRAARAALRSEIDRLLCQPPLNIEKVEQYSSGNEKISDK